jgi:hypothetical protein
MYEKKFGAKLTRLRRQQYFLRVLASTGKNLGVFDSLSG